MRDFWKVVDVSNSKCVHLWTRRPPIVFSNFKNKSNQFQIMIYLSSIGFVLIGLFGLTSSQRAACSFKRTDPYSFATFVYEGYCGSESTCFNSNFVSLLKFNHFELLFTRIRDEQELATTADQVLPREDSIVCLLCFLSFFLSFFLCFI